MRTLGQVSVIGVESRRKGMLRQSENIVHRLFTRQICRARPNTHIHQARRFYENIVPSHTVYDVECPDHSFRKFTNDGKYLICFSRNHQDLIVYRYRGLSHCIRGQETDHFTELSPRSKKFESFFVLLYTIPLATGAEVICKEFFLATDNNLYGLFATSTSQDLNPPAVDGAVSGVPSIEKIALFLVRLSDGYISDERVYHDDFIHLSHNMGVFLYDDLLAILSIRYQCIRLLQIRETGRFVDVRTIGQHCREDDELVLNSQAQEEDSYIRNQAAFRKARGLPAQAEVASKRILNSQGNAWPLEWNLRLKHGVANKGAHSGRNRRSSNPHGANSGTTNFPSNAEEGSGNSENRMNGIYGGIQGADLDLQYDHYFRGLFANLEDDGHTNDVATGVPAAPGDVVGRVNPGRQERPRSPTQTPPYANGDHSVGVDLRGVYGQIENVYGGSPVDVSVGGSGVHHTAGGLVQYGRSHSSASGDSLERYASGRGSPSVRHTSTTGTSSESCSRSGGSRWEPSVSGGGSINYGTGTETGQNGSIIVQSSQNNQLEFVVSSRSRMGLLNGRYVRPPEDFNLPTSSPHGTHHHENGHGSAGIAGSSAGLVRASGHRRTLGAAVQTLDSEDTARTSDRYLPSRFATQRGGGSGGERAAPSTESPSRPSMSHRDMASDGHTARAETAVVPPAARSVHEVETNGAAQRIGAGAGAGAGADQVPVQEESTKVLGGVKQRLLSFIFQSYWDQQDLDPKVKAQRLNRFYYHFQQYSDLVMWKVQFLDRYHLLIKFGSGDGVHRNADNHQTSFFAVYNLETTEMLGFFQNSSEELSYSFENFCDHFRVVPRFPLYMKFISSYSNNVHLREQLRKQRVACSNKSIYTLAVKRTLAWLPFNSQCQSPSVYFDQSLFHYDEKLISAMERHKPCLEHPIKFISRRKNSLKFKINPGSELSSHDGRSKRVASFVFHPIFPFAISIQQSFMQPSIINFHFRK